MSNPLAEPYLVLTKVYSGGKYLKQAIADTPMALNSRAKTVKISYGVLEKDEFLTRVILKNARTKPKQSICVILKIALYMLEFLQKKDYTTVDFAVELTKKLGKSGAASFVNGFLRGYELPEIPTNADDRLSYESSAPLWLAKKARRSYKSQAAEILSAPSQGVCVRFEKNIENYLHLPHLKTPFENVVIFKNFVRDGGFFEGDYTFQSIGSVAICTAISPCERLLDACAAPGGKSVLLSKKCKEIISAEIHAHRVKLIEEYCARMNVKNVTAMQCDSTVYKSEWSEYFDAVLCDVPCSGTGVINENPDIKLFRREEDIKSLNELQFKILENCARYVKSGGKLYYSTCSILPEENDSVVYNFLRLHPEYALDIPYSPLENRRTKFGLQFLPHVSLGAGFFITCFVKK